MEQVIACNAHYHLITTEWILAHSALLVCDFVPVHCMGALALAFALAFVTGTCSLDVFLLGPVDRFNVQQQIWIRCTDSIGSVIDYRTNGHL